MAEKRKLVVLVTCGMEDERSSVAFSVANGGVKSGLEVMIFLASSGVDWARKGAAEAAHLNPMDPTIGEMIGNLEANGVPIVACTPCAKVRGYTEADLRPGVKLAGSPAMHEWIAQGAAVISL